MDHVHSSAVNASGQGNGRRALDADGNGRVDVVLDSNDTAWISWMGSDGDQPKLSMRGWPRGGDLDDVHYLGDANTRRGSGFPRMTWTGDGIIMATTNAADGYKIELLKIDTPKID